MKITRRSSVYLPAGMVVLACLAGCNVADSGASSASPAETRAAAVSDPAKVAALRQRASAFGDLLPSIRTMSRKKACHKLQLYIVPSEERRNQVLKYYGDFSAKSEKFPILSQSVTNVEMEPGAETARVTYEMVAQGPDDLQVPAEQETIWQKVDGEWYRALTDPVARLR